MNHRSIFDRFFSLCLGFFVACVLVYAGVQLVQAVLGWLLVIGVVAGALALISAVVRWRRDRW